MTNTLQNAYETLSASWFGSFFERIDEQLLVLFTIVFTVFIIILFSVFSHFRKARLKTYRTLLYEDELTGLKKSQYLRDYFNNIVIAFDQNVSMYYINLDNFKNYNDIFGHHLGNQMLIEMAHRLKQVLTHSHVYRVHSDHFILLNRTGNDKHMQFTESLLNVLKEPYHIAGHEIKLTVSVGRYDMTKSTPRFNDSLLMSELALQEAKALGKDQCVVYSDAIKDKNQDAFKLFRLIKEAIRERYFMLEFQPIMKGSDLSFSGVEALIRIRYNNKTYYPQEMIEYAERFNLIEEIDRYVVKEAFSAYKRLKKKGVPMDFMSINISTKEIHNLEFISYMAEEADNAGVNPGDFTVEFTETFEPQSIDMESSFIETLRSHGFKVAIDDFGSGYSSMMRLRQNDLDKIKIDRVFITNIAQSSANQKIVRAMCDLAKGFHLDVIVEGVETKEDLAFIQALGVDYIQGYYFYQALSERKLIKMFID